MAGGEEGDGHVAAFGHLHDDDGGGDGGLHDAGEVADHGEEDDRGGGTGEQGGEGVAEAGADAREGAKMPPGMPLR